MSTDSSSAIYAALEALAIPFEKFDHPPLFTCEDSEKYELPDMGGHTKNLFIRNKRGDKYYLVTVCAEKRVDLKALAKLLAESKLSFASPERLMEVLKLTPGSVSPFALINDTEKQVTVIIDNGLMRHDRLGYHPGLNTQTLVITSKDLPKFLEAQGYARNYIEL